MLPGVMNKKNTGQREWLYFKNASWFISSRVRIMQCNHESVTEYIWSSVSTAVIYSILPSSVYHTSTHQLSKEKNASTFAKRDILESKHHFLRFQGAFLGDVCSVLNSQNIIAEESSQYLMLWYNIGILKIKWCRKWFSCMKFDILTIPFPSLYKIIHGEVLKPYLILSMNSEQSFATWI